jgi:hypothetical protein
MSIRMLAAAVAVTLAATAAQAEATRQGFYCNSAPVAPTAKPAPTVVKPAVKPKAAPSPKGFFCNSDPASPAAPAGGPPPSGGLSTETGEHESGTGGHGDDKGGSKKDQLAPATVSPATLQTQQQPAPTPQ